MPDEASSLHLRNAHELFLLIPTRYGFVKGADRRTSYARRLDFLLNMLFAPTQSAVEKTLMPRASFADTLQNLYHFHYGVVDQFQQSKLILSATFDSSWEAYFRNLVDGVGPILDAVFCHCQNFAGRTCADGYDAFADFIREHQVQAGILYAATPDLTSDDLRMFRNLHRLPPNQGQLPAPSAEAEADVAAVEWRKRYRSKQWQGEQEFERLRAQAIVQFVNTVWEARKLFPASERIDSKRTAQQIFDEAVTMLAASIDREDFLLGKKVLDQTLGQPGNNPELQELRKFVKYFAGELGKKEKQKENDKELGRTRQVTRSAAKPKLDANLVQNNIITSCGSTYGYLALIRFPSNKAAQLLRQLAQSVRNPVVADVHINVALTYAGLRRVGLDDGTLQMFPKEFRAGMEQRAGALGDVGWPNHPDYWHQVDSDGRRLALPSVDLVVLVHGKKSPSFDERAEKLLAPWGKLGGIVLCQPLERMDPDPFGYSGKGRQDNQPELAKRDFVKQVRSPAFDNQISAGDLFLGHKNSYGEIARAACPEHNPLSDLFLNGTFLVIRKLAQNPDSFAYFARATKRHGGSVEARRADILGVTSPQLGANVDYQKDVPHPPLDAHVRRVNPRDGMVPRIVRRSFTYRDDDGPGHMFMAYNANIAQQYEVLQRWINGGNSTGLPSAHKDPLASQHVPHQLEDAQAPYRVPHVSLRWGMYLFVPSKKALFHLAAIAGARDEAHGRDAVSLRKGLQATDQARLQARGEKLIRELDGIRDRELARESWKQLFEEPSREEDGRAVWAAIRAGGGRKQTPYGFLVGDQEGVGLVLGDDGSKFSVKGYRQRLIETIGDFYLGIDSPRCPYARQRLQPPDYGMLAKANIALRAKLDGDKVFGTARDLATAFLDKEKVGFELRDLAREVVGKISVKHIGIPEKVRKTDQELRKYLDHFIDITRYLSFPYPESWVQRKALDSGQALLRDYAVEDASDPAFDFGEEVKTWGGIGHTLFEGKYPDGNAAAGDPVAIRSAIIGANVGFVPPTISMLSLTMSKWIQNGDIEHPRIYSDGPASDAPASLKSALIRDLSMDPTFTTIFRTAVEGNGWVAPGTIVVVGAQSAYEDSVLTGAHDPYHWLFGGRYEEKGTHGPESGRHGCPVAAPAIDIMAGTLHALALHIRKRLEAGGKRTTLVRIGPARYMFDQVHRVLPGR